MLGRLATDERAARLSASVRDAVDELRGLRRVEPPHGDVVEEEEWFCAAADDVVGTHRDEVDPDRVVPPECGGDRRLRPDPVGRRDQDRLPVARGDRDGPGKAAEPADDLGPPGALDRGPHELDGLLAGIDIDTGTHVRRSARISHARKSEPAPSTPNRHPRTEAGGGAHLAELPLGVATHPSEVSSRMNLREAASYGTGSG